MNHGNDIAADSIAIGLPATIWRGRMKSYCAALAVLIVTLFPQTLHASDETREMAIVRALALNDFASMSAEQRRDFASASLDYWRHFDSRVPRNAPSEREWLDGELRSQDSGRVNGAVMSPAYGRFKLSGISENCIEIFNQLIGVISGDQAAELYLWLKSTQCFADEGIVHYLKRAQLSDGTYDGDFKMQSFSVIFSTITGKLANSVIAE